MTVALTHCHTYRCVAVAVSSATRVRWQCNVMTWQCSEQDKREPRDRRSPAGGGREVPAPSSCAGLRHPEFYLATEGAVDGR